jgi:ATP-dependent helicase/DNAse subunit B
MNFRIFIGPSRELNLDELFRRTPIGDGCVCAVVPDAFSSLRLERRITMTTGGAALGMRIYTFERLARAIVAHDRIPPELIPGHVKKALIREIVRSRIGTRSRWYPISSTPGFVSLVTSFLEDIRSGVGTTAHDPDLSAVEKAYKSHLARLDMTDHEGFVSLALENDIAATFAASFDGPLIVEGFYNLTPHQFELVSRLAMGFKRSAASVVCDQDNPNLFSLAGELCDRFRGIGAIAVDVPAEPISPVEKIIASFAGNGDASDLVMAGATLQTHTFRSENAEADWIAGTIGTLITRDGVKAEDIMVVTRETPSIESPLYTSLRRHGIPSESEPSERIAAHPLVRHILNAFDASISPSEERLAAVGGSNYTMSGDNKASHDRCTDTVGWSSMITSTDSPDGFVESIERMIESLGIERTIGSDRDTERKQRDIAVLERFRSLLAAFGSFYRPFRPMLEARECNHLLRLFLSDASLHPTPVSRRGVIVTGALHARFIERPVVFMAGMSAETVPARHDRFTLHDPGTARSIRERRDREEPLLFRLSMSGALRIFCTFPGLDNEGSADGMSPYLRELIALSGVVPKSHAGVPGAAWENGAAGTRGRLEQIVKACRTSAFGEAAFLHYLAERAPEIATMVSGAFRRRVSEITRYGFALLDMQSHEQLANDWGRNREFAVTALEAYRKCPVGFFFNRIIGIETAEITANGLDNLERGIIIHEILADLYNQLLIENGTARVTAGNLATVAMLLEKTANGVFDHWRYRLRRFHPPVFDAERARIVRWLKGVLEIESRLMESALYTPAHFEVSFGGDKPLDIGIDGIPLLIRGRIDRIDISSGEYPSARVVDYKTGQPTARADIEDGKAIQLPLYLRAAALLFPLETIVREGVYYNLREVSFDEKNRRLKNCPAITEDIGAAVDRACAFAREAAAGIRSGVFPPPEKCNRFCELQPLCRGGMELGEEDADAGQ